MELWWLGRGLLLGFSIAAPVGPIGVLVIRSSITAGRGAGLMTGLGAASADAVYGLAGGLGLGALAPLIDQGGWLRLGGGGFLLWLGMRTLLAPPARIGRGPAQFACGRTFLTGLLLTLANPLTILSFTAMFAGLGAGQGTVAIGWLVTGVFGGSALWWVILSAGASLMRARMTPDRLRWVNRGSGLLIMAFGAAGVLAALVE
jgi:threonine/homoserine/homoserine lactone efflux protein